MSPTLSSITRLSISHILIGSTTLTLLLFFNQFLALFFFHTQSPLPSSKFPLLYQIPILFNSFSLFPFLHFSLLSLSIPDFLSGFFASLSLGLFFIRKWILTRNRLGSSATSFDCKLGISRTFRSTILFGAIRLCRRGTRRGGISMFEVAER